MLIFKNLDMLQYYDFCETWQQKRYVEDCAYGLIVPKRTSDFLKKLKSLSREANAETSVASINKMTMKEIVVENLILKLKHIFPSVNLKKEIQNCLVLKKLNIREILSFLKDVEQYSDDNGRPIGSLDRFQTTLQTNPSTTKPYSNMLHILKRILEQSR